MSPSDKNKSTGNSSNGEGQTQLCSESCVMDFSSASTSPSTSNVTLPGHGTIVNIPWVTASPSTIKCSVNDQMKTFDPGEDGGIERLTSKNSGNSVFVGKSTCSLLKNSNKNYKAGSKINKLADMLAKRSQNVVEVKQNITSDLILDIPSAPKAEDETVISNSVSNVIKSINGSLLENTSNSNELKLFRKSRRKSVPSQSCNLHQWQLQATSKSCSDISELFPLEENEKIELHALGKSIIKLQTDESTKKKVIRKNLRNVKLPLILPEKKRRPSLKNDSLISIKILEKVVEDSSVAPTEIIGKSKESPNEIVPNIVPSSKPSFRCSKVKKENKVKQRKSKRLVENSTQTADLEFISVIKPNTDLGSEKPVTEEVDKPTITYECLYCTQTFTLGSLCKAHEKTHFLRNATHFKCQFCSKTLISLDELKSHCVSKHPNKYAYCMKCDERFSSKDELYFHNKDIHLNKNGENQSVGLEESLKNPSPEKKLEKPEELEERADKKLPKTAPKADLKIDISFDSSKKSSISPRNVQKFSPKETKTEEQLLEMEMLFYSHLSGNIQENLSNHLDGKIDKSGNPVRTDQIAESPENVKASSLLSVDIPTAGIPEIQVSRAPSPYQTRSKTPNPLPPTAKKFKKLPNWQQKFWEKYNFPTNYRYEHRFWDKNYLNTEKSAFYLKDLSCLDIKTQLTMRENIKKLDEIKKIEENTKPADKLTFPDFLSLVPRINKTSSLENKIEVQRSGTESPKGKKQVGKEETKKSFKSPGFELPVVKNRNKVSSESSSGIKKQATDGVKMMTRRQSSLELVKDDKEENSKKRKGSLDSTGNQKMALRRQNSLDNLSNSASKVEKNEQILEINTSSINDVENLSLSPLGSPEISGEWVRPRSYLCGTCCTKFTNLWELEDHKWVSHPNVWCTHYEFEDEKIDKLFQKNESEGTEKESGESPEMSKSKLTDLYKRYLLPHGSLKTAKLVPKSNFPEQCTKCKKHCMNSSEMHKHMLDCGGDTTWFLTMYSSPMTIKRKWRPFGSRRKKQIGRRDVKRNIPSTPNLRPYHYQHRIRTKPGDVETIQKMLANLPEKRARRAINFDEIKTRSQATIHSNRLLRKRFKSTFSNNFLKLKAIKQKRQLKQKKKEGSSKSTTDTSSENTPVGSPKRKNKLKETLQLLKEENSRDGSSETSEDANIKINKKKVQSKKKEKSNLTHPKSDQLKVDKSKIKKEIPDVTKEKPVTRSNGFALPAKKKAPVVKEETSTETVSNNGSLADGKEQKSVSKSKKSTKKKSNKTGIKKEVPSSEDVPTTSESKGKGKLVKKSKKLKTEVKDSSEVKSCNKNNSHWVNARCNPILRLKQNKNAKTELLKSMQKKLKNSRKILEKKEFEKVDGGSRRSLRIKSLQQLESDSEILDRQSVDNAKKSQTVSSEKDFKTKTVVVSLENTVLDKAVKPLNGKSPKPVDQSIEKEVSELPVVRRSLRNSISFEEKPEIVKNDEKIVSSNPRSLLRKNLKNDSSMRNSAEDLVTCKTARVDNDENEKSVPGNSVVVAQVSLLKKNRLQSPRTARGIPKLEGPSESGSSDLSKNNDLEEMPILAKVEPIRGKISNKNEKEIPVLMPVDREQKKSFSHEDQTKSEDSVSFQVVKKRRKNSKEITPLKIVKKVDSVSSEGGSGGNKSFQVDNNDIDEDALGVGKSKKPKLSDDVSTGTTEKKFKTDVKKYFLGIDPTEIDKGRNEGQDESGSDNEPLISLISNHVPNECQNEKLIPKEENEVAEAEKSNVPEIPVDLEPVVKKSKDQETPDEPPVLLPSSEEKNEKTFDESPEIQHATCTETIKIKKKISVPKQKKKSPSKGKKELRVMVTLKDPTVETLENSLEFPKDNSSKEPDVKLKEETLVPPMVEDASFTAAESVLPQRRSRRISKETKSSNEFVIDDPLILVDELWSDLDSDSDSSKRKSKKGKKKSPKKKTSDEKRMSDVNLEELLRNFGENKETKKDEKLNSNHPRVKIVRDRSSISRNLREVRKSVENRKVGKSCRRLSLKLFRFNKTKKNFGNQGVKLSDAKKALQQKLDELQGKANAMLDLPFLAAEIKENPVQVIQCRAQKPKVVKKGPKKLESKCQNNDIRLKISLPLEMINNMTVFNNNHLTEPITEDLKQGLPIAEEMPGSKLDKEFGVVNEKPPESQTTEEEPSVLVETQDAGDLKNKSKRSEVIDKIFYCEICKTYYYSPSQLKIHKLSNRHKLKESELLAQNPPSQPELKENVETEKPESLKEPVPVVENVLQESSSIGIAEEERQNDDTLEMPTLEGPFIENPLTRFATEPAQTAPPPPPVTNFGFSQESLKDIQKAIGCTDEEMLILTLLGENTIEIENDILDLDSCKTTQPKPLSQKEKVDSSKENEKANGAFTVDLKQRMTSALACLVNKAVFNLLQKYETAAKSAVNPEALSLLGKLSNLSRRKNILQLSELLKKRNDGESSMGSFSKDFEKKEPTISYKYQCTICGSRFEKASTRECHISRSHKGKAKKLADDNLALQTTHEDEWNDSWSYDTGDDHLGSTNMSQFWCSDCGINFLSPQEVLEHQKLEHQSVLKEPEQNKDSGPLQSSTIGSSDEILEGKKTRRRPKLFSSEELDQQRILANNELRKLDRKFLNKNKNNKIKWGMDALKFTVEKENKIVVDEEEKEITPEEPVKSTVEVKNIDLVPKLNLSRISNIPEFKVIQKNSFENRFQKIIDNKLKRKCACPTQEVNAADEIEEEVMLVPVVLKKKNKKQKVSKCFSKKEDSEKPLDVYDFNESESEGEPAVYSHIKKPALPPTKLKLVKVKEGPSKNKADSTTKDLAPDDYDSEDSLPLSVVKKSKPGDEDDEKDEKISDDGMEKSDGILEQVEYLIEQLENETGSSKKENDVKEMEFENELNLDKDKNKNLLKEDLNSETESNSIFTVNESLRVSVANEFLELEELQLKNQIIDKEEEKTLDLPLEEERVEETLEQEGDSILAEPESSQSTFDEEDSIPLVLISKKSEKSKFNEELKKCDENTTDVSTTASEDVSLTRGEETKCSDVRDSSAHPQVATEESLPLVFSSSENEGIFSEKPEKPFETLNGNVIYCRNDSITDFDSDISSDGLIDSNFDKNNSRESDKNFIEEVTEKEDVVIVCSKGVNEESNESKSSRKLGDEQVNDPENSECLLRKKKRFPLLTATIEENNFRRSESPKSNKEVIVRKIWNRKRVTEESTDNDEDSFIFLDDSNLSIENLQEDESQTEIEKEIIVKKIWSRKKQELEDEFIEKVEEKFNDIKINQTEISDEVVIKCGPKAKSSPKRRKSKSSTNEASKDTIMRKIWSGRCTFQTKAALKTYDCDVLPNCKENEISGITNKSKRRKRPSSVTSTKRIKAGSDPERDDDDDDLDSLIEEIEREQLEKAIRSEFLQLRRSEKANIELKEGVAPTVGLFTETTLNSRKEISEKKRRKIKKKIKHPRQSVLKRKKLIRKPFRRVLPSEERNFSESTNRTNLDGSTEQSENSLDKNPESFGVEAKTKNRKHKKHRHKHHHHKHKHKKSKHHKSAISKHKSKHEFVEGKEEKTDDADSFTILKKICQEIPNQIESESQLESRNSSRKGNLDEENGDSKVSDMFSFDGSPKGSADIDFENGLLGKKRFDSVNIYEFVEDVPDFSTEGLRNVKK